MIDFDTDAQDEEIMRPSENYPESSLSEFRLFSEDPSSLILNEKTERNTKKESLEHFFNETYNERRSTDSQ